ncbi:MAG: hypothetical protein AAFW64_03505 [Pseudomonadota bacterium]
MHRVAAAVALGLFAVPAQAQEGMELQRCVWRCLSAFGPATGPAYHQCVADQCTALGAAPSPALSTHTGGWGDLNGLMVQSFGLQGLVIPGEGESYWLPDAVDPGAASVALGFYYYIPPGGGNAVRLSVGYFQRTRVGFSLVRPVTGLFGHNPRDAVFSGPTIEVTTTMLRPGEPRCCPTGQARWSFDRRTGVVTQLSGP